MGASPDGYTISTSQILLKLHLFSPRCELQLPWQLLIMGRFSHIKLLFVALIATSSTFGALLEKPQDLSKAYYDFIIVGGMCQTPYVETLCSFLYVF